VARVQPAGPEIVISWLDGFGLGRQLKEEVKRFLLNQYTAAVAELVSGFTP
jgi:hypothetical protein